MGNLLFVITFVVIGSVGMVLLGVANALLDKRKERKVK